MNEKETLLIDSFFGIVSLFGIFICMATISDDVYFGF